MTTVLCGFCEEPIEEGDCVAPFVGGAPMHQECGIRLVIGSVAHLEKRCSCFVRDSEEDDPPHMTKRQAARLAITVYNNLRARN